MFTLPLLGALIGWILVLLLYFFAVVTLPTFSRGLFKRIPSLFKGKKISAEDIQQQLSKVNWQQELDPLVDQKLDLFIENLQKKIPMVGMLLKGSLGESLKGQAKEQFGEMIPEMQSKMALQISEKIEIEELLEEQLPKMIDPASVEEMLQEWLKRHIFKLSLFGAFGGFLLGLLFFYLRT